MISVFPALTNNLLWDRSFIVGKGGAVLFVENLFCDWHQQLQLLFQFKTVFLYLIYCKDIVVGQISKILKHLFSAFRTDSKVHFHLNTHNNKKAVIKALQKIAYVPGSSNMADGLQTLRTTMFNPPTGDRAVSLEHSIILT